MELDPSLPPFVREVHEKLYPTDVLEPFRPEELDGFRVPSHGLDIEVLDPESLSLFDCHSNEGAPDSFPPMGMVNDHRFHFRFFIFKNHSEESNDLLADDCDPNVLLPNFRQMLVEMLLRILSANRRVTVDLAVALSQVSSEAAAARPIGPAVSPYRHLLCHSGMPPVLLKDG